MKTIGLLGGMSWESTVPYYRIINETVRDAQGGLHSAKIVMHSVDFHEIDELQSTGMWDEAGRLLASLAESLEAAGADVVVLCTNTMHRVAPAIERAVSIPLLHIADPTAAALTAAGVTRVGLLGTRFTMEEKFYRDRLESVYGIDVVVPGETDRATVHRVIYDELVLGMVSDASRMEFRQLIERMVTDGAQAVILGCTEIGLLVRPCDATVPLLDTTELHARAAARWAMEESGDSRTSEEVRRT